MTISSHQPEPRDVQPHVRLDARHCLILLDGSAEHRLFNPTLEAMLRRYLDYPESRSETREWIIDTNPFSPFSFVALCEYLDLDANYVRRGLTRWMDNVDGGLGSTTTSQISGLDVSCPSSDSRLRSSSR